MVQDGGGWSTPCPSCFNPGKSPVPTIQEARWAHGLICRKSHPIRVQTLNCPTCRESLYWPCYEWSSTLYLSHITAITKYLCVLYQHSGLLWRDTMWFYGYVPMIWKSAASIFYLEVEIQLVSLTQWWLPMKIHDIASQKTTLLIPTATKTSNFTYVNMFTGSGTLFSFIKFSYINSSTITYFLLIIDYELLKLLPRTFLIWYITATFLK